ncbi:hypothetical protein BKA81DRAFT_92526 [Phyllosticta paracitricarpa]
MLQAVSPSCCASEGLPCVLAAVSASVTCSADIVPLAAQDPPYFYKSRQLLAWSTLSSASPAHSPALERPTTKKQSGGFGVSFSRQDSLFVCFSSVVGFLGCPCRGNERQTDSEQPHSPILNKILQWWCAASSANTAPHLSSPPTPSNSSPPTRHRSARRQYRRRLRSPDGTAKWDVDHRERLEICRAGVSLRLLKKRCTTGLSFVPALPSHEGKAAGRSSLRRFTCLFLQQQVLCV